LGIVPPIRLCLDNNQNFAKAFKVRDFRILMASQKANEARVRSAIEFGKTEMSERLGTPSICPSRRALRRYGTGERVDGGDVLAHLTLNVTDFYSNQNQRDLVVELVNYLAGKLESMRPDEVSSARVLRDLVRNQRLA
jgi:putative DNA methylase